MRRLLMVSILFYQRRISRYFGLRCRFVPSCSQYALEAVEQRGMLVGVPLTIWRLCRCHPWGGCGHDPVPGGKGDGL